MATIPSKEIKRRGISAVDEALKKGPVHVIRNDAPTYVVMREEDYRQFLDDLAEARLTASESDFEAGRQKKTSPKELLAEIEE